MSVELWLVRHGETEWRLSGKHTSRTDIALTEQGRRRAAVLRNYLAGRKFDRVLVSPMQRARETCPIAGYGNAALVDEGLREWDYGVYEGRTTAEIRAEVPGWSVWKNEIVGGETVEHVGERADGVIARALEPLPERSEVGQTGLGAGSSDPEAYAPATHRAILFAHAHILRILAARWIGLPAVGGQLFALGTGSLSVLGWERETRVIGRWNREFEE
jgi:broad specificity phosphatase PhoE